MHVILSRYAGLAPRVGEAAPKVREGFVPLVSGCPGFLGYAALASEQGDIWAVTVWEDAAAAAGSRDRIRGWVRDNLRGIAPEEPTERKAGDAMLHALAEPQSGGRGQSLYCIVRGYEGVPDERQIRPIAERVIAEYRKADGFRGVYVVRDPRDASRLTSVLFCDSREHAERMFREVTQAAMPQGMTQRVVASGQTAVLAMA
jgi:heme-degrading monooxygenase HmoA